MDENIKFMKAAIKEALKALDKDEVPVGAVIVKDGKIIARGHNLREKKQQATAHAEIIAIEKACRKLGTWRLDECDLYVTLEPCPMCTGATILSRIRKVVFGAYDPKGGSVVSTTSLYEIEEYNHHPKYVEGVMADECGKLLRDFFKSKRDKGRR